MLENPKKGEVPGLVREAADITMLESEVSSRGTSLIDPERLKLLKEKRSLGRLSVGLGFLFDNLKNHMPQNQEHIPAFAKEVQTKLDIKKIPLPDYAKKHLLKMQRQKLM